ncbi:TPA: hypothetical protein U5D93_003926 [Yersinia enterocolitica]|uniref:hypothetical protein n=1 Tax=Yersinia enterocolitica TaxID=630 RepID=UPI00119E6F5B|nr:hypothetical protein [Yersinia enterocolitica]HDL6777754.1 hypothetical protein [Yersinia enterocolitica]HDL8372260.1 hypothetical protein [Yersinia enterocolitica]HDM8312457.1 hypothetical protein [Yersinia enterocolitica]HDV7144133.1 hypothetical protein [Yersinia enterocolitica]
MKKVSRKVPAHLEINNSSVLTRVRYLESIIQSPAEYQENMTLSAALKSQGGLAKLSVSEPSISPVSLNTLKNRANDLLPGGFTAIDHLRLQASKAIRDLATTKSTSPSSSITKQDLKDKVKAQKRIISQLWDEIALVTNIFRESIILAHQFAEKCPDPADLSLFKKRRRELLSMLSLSKQPRAPSHEDQSHVE